MPEPVTPAQINARHERTESARLDNFVDGAFAFAITLLIISGGGLPRSVDALEHALLGVPAFAVCFAQLAWFWHAHVRWRDTVRLTDRGSLLLSLLLVFFALIFVFPLHLVYSDFFNSISGGTLSPDVTRLTSNTRVDVAALFVCYGLSYACMAGTLAMLYRHGARTATWLDRKETGSARLRSMIFTYVAAVGLFSALLALVLPAQLTGLSGSVYFLLALIGPVAKYHRSHKKAALPP